MREWTWQLCKLLKQKISYLDFQMYVGFIMECRCHSKALYKTDWVLLAHYLCQEGSSDSRQDFLASWLIVVGKDLFAIYTYLLLYWLISRAHLGHKANLQVQNGKQVLPQYDKSWRHKDKLTAIFLGIFWLSMKMWSDYALYYIMFL